MTLNKDSKIYIAGHKGLVGSAIWRNLEQRGYRNLVGRSHRELDLTDQIAVRNFFDSERPDAVVLAAAFVGGIMANSIYRADFIMQNMKMQCNVIENAYLHDVKKLLFLGSTCIYPKAAPQPMKEDALLTSPLEYTNEEYAIAKIAGLKMCESYNLQYGTNYIAVMPTNLYGPNDNFHLENSHVMPAMMRKIYLAKLIHNGDCDALKPDMNQRPINPTDALRSIIGEGIEKYSSVFYGSKVDGAVDRNNSEGRGGAIPALGEIRNCHINVGSGKELTIKDLATKVAKAVDFTGTIVWDATKPNGTPRKLIDVEKLHRLGWHHKVDIDEGISRLYQWYKRSLEQPF